MLCCLEVPWTFTPRPKETMALKQAFALPLAVIGGEWHFFVNLRNPDARFVNFPVGSYVSFSCGVAWTGARGRFSVEEVKLELWSNRDGIGDRVPLVLGKLLVQGHGCFPGADDGRLEGDMGAYSHPASEPSRQFTLKLFISCPEDRSRQLVPAAGRYTTLLDDMHPNNLALVFRRGTLWTNSQALAEASPYFRHLLESGFEETASRTADDEVVGVRPRDVHAELDFNDSDDESADDTAPKCGSPSSFISPATCSFPIHKVSITSASYTTYRALLCWLYTSHITFAPLLSTFRHSQTRSAVRDVRRSAVKALTSENPNLPLPPSPKSIYRLADLLELPVLKKLALAALKSQIGVENVAYELFGDVSGWYPEVREMELEFAAKHWAEVKASTAMREVQELIEADELPYATSVWAELAMRL